MPARYGLDGSDAMRSYRSRAVSSVSRASPIVMCTFGLFSTSRLTARARARDVENERLDFDDVDAVDRRDGAEPSGRTARAQADDERASRIRMRERAEEAAHDLRAGVVPRAAVRFAVDDERIAGAVLGEGDAAFGAVAFPDDLASHERFPTRGSGSARRTPGRARHVRRRCRCAATRPSARLPRRRAIARSATSACPATVRLKPDPASVVGSAGTSGPASAGP